MAHVEGFSEDPESEAPFIETRGQVFRCWACGRGLDGYLEEAKCSFCGALSDFRRGDTKPALLRMVFAISDLVSVPAVRRIWSFFMVLFVLAAINTISVLGVFYIYPDFLGSASRLTFSLHWLSCIWLWTNTLLNYAQSVLRDPGFVAVRRLGNIGPGALEGYRFCRACGKGKPPGSHHCRICRQCVYDMDHHCPFIGNCVGRGNRRSFVVFLFWSTVSVSYVLAVTVTYCLDHMDDITQNVNDILAKLPPLSERTLPFYITRLVEHSYAGVHLHAASVLLLLCCTVFSMTGSLLAKQIRLLRSGETTISRLQGRKRGSGTSATAKTSSCDKVFGIGPWWTWVLPQLYPHRAVTKTV
ncbi:PAT11 [Symbiodinium sp. KB8]|nr:PAT11 [Symbiodinium sp. KB8]